MNDFIEGISDLFRYNMHDERAAFERQIDEEPMDANTHLIYADWLDDHDEPQEAAFRRAMGNWFADHHRSGTDPRGTTQYFPQSPYGSPLLPPRTVTSWHAGFRHQPDQEPTDVGMPEGVRAEHFDSLTDTDWDVDWESPDRPDGHRPYQHSDAHTGHALGWQWDSYRDMEEAFRRAFRPNNN